MLAGLVATLALALALPAAASAACAPPTTDAYAKAVLGNGPVAYYRFDEATGPTLCDASSQLNNGSYAPSGITFGAPGALLSTKDPAITADGTQNTATSSANAAVSGNSSFTYETWFRSATTQNHALVDIGNSGNGNIAGLTVWSGVGGVSNSELGLDEFAGSNIFDTLGSGINLFDGNWHYLVVAYNASTASVTGYADAHSLGSQHLATSSGTFSIAATPIRVGYWIDTVVNHPLLGGEDDLAVYAKALSASQVLAHYKAAGYAPKIKKLTPNAGPTGGGNTVTITGTGFTSDATVAFGTTPAASVAFVSPTELQALAPAGSGVVRVAVTSFLGTSPATTADLYAYGPPSVSSISPTSGPAAGGTAVTINGSGFVPGAQVHFGSRAGSKVKFVSSTKLTAVSPSGRVGAVDVTVATAAGTSATSPADFFTYG